MASLAADPSLIGQPGSRDRIPTPAANLATANELSDTQKREIKTETRVMQGLLGYENFL